MTDEDITNFNDSITKKLGAEHAATIADDIGILITKHSEAQRQRESQEARIKELEGMNEKLVRANANLIHQIPMDNEPTPQSKTREDSTTSNFNLRDAFDEKGRFKR